MPFLKVVVALYDYEANTEEELTISENNVLYVLEDDDPEWWKAKLKTEDPNENKIGLIPSNYVEPLPEIGSAVGLYKYEATNEEELTFDEGDALVLYEQDDPDWLLVGNATSVGFVPSNYVEVSASQEAQHTPYDSQEQGADQAEYDHQEQPQQYEEDLAASTPTITVTASAAAPPEKDDLSFWSVNEVDKKKKKKKGSLGVGNHTIFFGSEEDKSPVRQWSIKDVEKVRVEKKHVYLDLGGENPASFDFSAASKAEAEAIFNKVQESKQKSRISRPAASTVAVPPAPSIRDSIISTSTYQTAPGSPHLAPEPQPEEVPEVAYDYEQPQEVYQEQLPVVECEGRWAISMYDFQAENEEELTVQENEEVWVSDYVSSDEWWKCQVGDRVGIVPASYLRWADEVDPNVEQQPEAEPVPEEEAPALPAPVPVAASIPAPPPLPSVARAEDSAVKTPKASAAAPAPAAVAKPKNTRVWTDRSGTFKVEAEFLGYHDGKISLHKLNGVKIAVPVSKMSVDDVQYVEKMTGQKIAEDSVFDWYDFFIKAGIATEDALRYSTVFRTEKMDSSILPELSRDVLKGLNVKEGDIIRIRKAAGTGSSSPTPAESGGSTTPKPKKSVSFAAQDSTSDEADRDLAMKLQAEEVTQARTMHMSYAEQRRQQELQDEQFARELQERENSSNRTPVFGKKKDETPQRKVSRPKPSSSASTSVDASKFSKIGSMLASTPASTPPSSSSAPKSSGSAKKPATSSQKNNPHTEPGAGFEDDAWELREVLERTAKFDYDNWKVQNRENEDDWIAKFAASTAPKEEPEPETESSKPAEPAQPAGRPRPKAPERTESDNSLGSLNLIAPITPTSPSPGTPPTPAKPSTPVPGSLDAMKLTKEEEAEKVRQQMQKIKEKQESDRVKKELEQVKAQQNMLHNALLQQATQNQQLVNHIRRMAPPPPPPRSVGVQPTGTGALPAPLVPVNPTGPLRFVPTHPTGQTSQAATSQPTFSTANMGLPSVQQAMPTGVMPQMTGVPVQSTGRANWANATPENPFGIGAVAVNTMGAPRAPQGIIAARSAPPVPPQPFINRSAAGPPPPVPAAPSQAFMNRSAPGPPPPIPAPMQSSMMTGMMQNQMTGVSAPGTSAPSLNAMRVNGINANMTGAGGAFQSPAMTGMNAVRPMQTGFQGTNNSSMIMTSGALSTSVPFQNSMMTGMSMGSMQQQQQPTSQSLSFSGAGATGNNLAMNQMMNNSLNNSNNSNLTSSAQFQSPMLTGMSQVRPMQTGMGAMGGLNNNNNNNNTLGGMGNMSGMNMGGMGGMGGLHNNVTGLGGGGMSSSMTGLGGNNSSSSQFNKPPSMMGGTSPGSLSSSTFSNVNNSRILQSSSPVSSFGNSNNSNNLAGSSSPMPLAAQPTGHLPMASSYMRPPPGGSFGGLGNTSAGMGGAMGNQSMTGMGNQSMTGMGQMGQMGMMNTGLGGMGAMSSAGGMSGPGLMPQMTGAPMGNMGSMGMSGQPMGGMGMNPQMTGMAGLNGVNGNMGGMGMNNNSNNLNNGQFNRW